MLVTPFYAAVLGLLFVILSVRTLRLRRSLQIPIGDAGNQGMLRAMRVHANFAEYVPLSLILTHLVEAQDAHAALVHALCMCLLAGRLSHAFGVSQASENYKYRVFGMAMTFTSLVVSSAYLLFVYARHVVA